MPAARHVGAVMDDAFVPVDATTTAFVEAVIAYAPVRLAPLRTQLADARTCNADNGWIDVENVADGSSIDRTPYNPCFDLFPGHLEMPFVLGPRGCHYVGLHLLRGTCPKSALAGTSRTCAPVGRRDSRSRAVS